MKTKEEISKILDEILDNIEFYNKNIATRSYFCANSIILPNELYFYFTSIEFQNEYLCGNYGIFPISYKNGDLSIFSMKCYRTSKNDKISVEYK